MSTASTLIDGPEFIHSVCEFTEQLGKLTEKDKGNLRWKLSPNPGIRLQLQVSEQDALTEMEAFTLASIIKTVPSKFKRIEVALRVTLSLLSLATTPWLAQKHDLEDDVVIFGSFSKRPMAKMSSPYFPYQHSDEGGSRAAAPSSWNARSYMLLLGIILLELLHGVRIHEQSTWEIALEDGEDESTAFLSAFLWVQRSREDLEAYFGKHDGGRLCDAIRKCICFDFQYTKDPEAGDSRLADLVFEEIMGPLQCCCPVPLVR